MATVAASQAAADGRETARLYEQYGDQLYRYCYARLRSREEAEDAVQSVWVRVHGALLKGVQPRFEAAWLYKIAHNVCLSRREVTTRLAQREETIDPAELDWALAVYDAKPEELFALPAALAEMPKNLRDAFLLREWQGLSYAEIAEALGTTVSAVETLIFRARRHLAAALAPPEEKRPLAARLADVGWLYAAGRTGLAQLRSLLAAAAPAKVAAGAAILAVGGVGVEQAVVAAAADSRDRTPTVAHASAVAEPAPPGAGSPVPHVAAMSVTVFPAEVKRRAARPQATAPMRRARAAAASAATARPLPEPVAEPEQPSATPVSASPPAAAPAPRPAPAPDVPTVTVPAVTVPSVTVPAVTVPNAPAPPVTVPTVTTPTVTVSVPTVTVTTPTIP